MLYDSFDHLKRKTSSNQKGDEEDNIGKLRTMLLTNGGNLICGDKCGYLWIFDPETLKLVDIFEAHEDQIVDLAFSEGDPSDPRSLLLATSSKDNDVKIYDSKENYKLLKIVDEH